MQPLASARVTEVGRRVVLAAQHPLGGEQPLDADWSAGVNSGRRNANFGAEAEPEAIGEPRARVVEHASAVDLLLEVLRREFCNKFSRLALELAPMPDALTIFRDDDVGVAAAEFVDVVDGAVQVFDDFDRDLE